MRFTACIIAIAIQAASSFADTTFGVQNAAEPSAADLQFIYDQVLPKEVHQLSPMMTLEAIFQQRPTADRKEDSDLYGKTYWEKISSSHLYPEMRITVDRKGIRNIDFERGITAPAAARVVNLVKWLLTTMGEPTEVFTRNLEAETPEAELFAIVWVKKEITVGLSFHGGDGHVYSTLHVGRAGLTARDFFTVTGSAKKGTTRAEVLSVVQAWTSKAAKLE